MWKLYILLVEIEAVFKSFKNDLGLRPIYHSVGERVEAHIFVCFLAYCLYVTLRQRLTGIGPGPDAAGGDGNADRGTDAGFGSANHRRAVAGDAQVYATRQGGGAWCWGS